MIEKFLKSAKYALQGLALGVKEERNLRIDLVAILFVTRFALFYDFNNTQWAILVIILFLIPSLELINTAIERAVAKPDDIHDSYAGQAKDTAARGVFFMTIGAVITAYFLFWNISIFQKIINYYTSNTLHILLLVIAVVLSYIFIIKDKFKGKK